MVNLDDVLPEIECNVPNTYKGSCKLTLQYNFREEHAVFPSIEEAKIAANGAVNPVVGGYHGATIEGTTDDVTQPTGVDWLFNF